MRGGLQNIPEIPESAAEGPTPTEATASPDVTSTLVSTLVR